MNLFADMGVQPLTLQAGLVAATASTDTSRRRRRSRRRAAAPTSRRTRPSRSPAPRPTRRRRRRRRRGLDRRRRDLASARPAARTGPTPGTPARRGTVTLVSRAVDDSGNLETAGRPASRVTVGTGTATCPCTIWVTGADARRRRRRTTRSAVELGVKFRSDVDGFVTGDPVLQERRRTPAPHVGNLWTRPATLLATATFTSEQRLRLAGGRRCRRRSRSPRTRPTSCRITRRRASTPATAATSPTAASTTARCTRCRTARTAPNGVYRVRRRARFPTRRFNSEQLLGRRRVRRRRSAPTRRRRQSVASTPASGATGVAVDGAGHGDVQRERSTRRPSRHRRSSCATPPNALVPATVGPTTRRRAPRRCTPDRALAYSTTYTATRQRRQRAASRTSPATRSPRDCVWSFTTSAPPPPPPTTGPGGPILVVVERANPFSRYYAEILRAEGLNEFAAPTSRTVTAAIARAPTTS